MSGQPPRIATWLLERLGPRNGSALLGDLREEWHRGRWRVWYWRQALTAISVNVFRDARVHPLLTVRALALGSLFLWFGNGKQKMDLLAT